MMNPGYMGACATCGAPQQWMGTYGPATMGWGGMPGYAPAWGGMPGMMGGQFGYPMMNPATMGPMPTGIGPTYGYGLGGLRRWGGSYTPQFIDTGLPTDEEITEMVYDALDDDPMVPWDADIDVTVDAGEVTLTGTVPDKRIKHAAGDDAWWIPGVTDVHNEIVVTGRHRARGEQAEKMPAAKSEAAPARRGRAAGGARS